MKKIDEIERKETELKVFTYENNDDIISKEEKEIILEGIHKESASSKRADIIGVILIFIGALFAVFGVEGEFTAKQLIIGALSGDNITTSIGIVLILSGVGIICFRRFRAVIRGKKNQ